MCLPIEPAKIGYKHWVAINKLKCIHTSSKGKVEAICMDIRTNRRLYQSDVLSCLGISFSMDNTSDLSNVMNEHAIFSISSVFFFIGLRLKSFVAKHNKPHSQLVKLKKTFPE